MKFSEYLKQINDFAKKNPNAMDLQVVTAKDDEGNGYELVGGFDGTGHYIREDRDFTPVECFEDWGYNEFDVNAVCIN